MNPLERCEWFIGWRYLYRRRHSRFLSAGMLIFLGAALATELACFGFGQTQLGALLTVPTVLLFIVFLLLNYFSVFTSVSIVGVVLGVAALTVVLSVTSGFQSSFKNKVLGVNAHVLVLKYGLDFSDYREVTKKALAERHVVAAAPFVLNEMMVATDKALSGVLIKGIDPELSPKVLDVGGQLLSGKLRDLAEPRPPNGGGPPLPEIFVGKELQKKLKVKLGDRVRVVSPKPDLDTAHWSAGGSLPSARDFRVAGVFYSGFDEYDRKLAYVNLPAAQAFYDKGDVVTGVEMKLDDVYQAPAVARRLDKALGGVPFRTMDWEELNHNLFTALRMQKMALVIFLTLIILVAAFNIVAALTMLVIDKTKEIAILKSMGMRSSGVARLFQVAGLTIGGVGVACGLGLGLLVCLVLERYGYRLDPRVYLIDKLPVELSLQELVLTAAITLGICFLATLYPALKAARLEPVEGLRYE